MPDNRQTETPDQQQSAATNRRQFLWTAGVGVVGLTGVSSVTATEHVTISWDDPGSSRGSGGGSVRDETFNVDPDILINDGEYTVAPTGSTVLAITNLDRGRTIEFALNPTEERNLQEIRLNDAVSNAGEIIDDPALAVSTPNGNVEIPVAVSGDRTVFSQDTLASYRATLREGDTTVDTTDSAEVVYGYVPRPQFQSDGESFRADLQRDGLPEDITIRFQLFSTEDINNAEVEREFEGEYVPDTDTFKFVGPTLDFDPQRYAIALRQNGQTIMMPNYGIFLPEIEPVDQIGNPDPQYATLSGQVTGAFDPAAGQIRATGTQDDTITTPISNDGSFDIEVPYEDSFQLAYVELEAGTDSPPVFNNCPDAYLLQQVSNATDETELETYQLPDAYRLDVTVVDSNGDPIEGARTWVRSYNPDTTAWYGWVNSTDNDGIYRFGPDTTGIEVGGPIQIVVEPNSDDDRIPDVPVTQSLDVSEATSLTVELDPVSVSGELRNVDTDYGFLYVYNNDVTGTFESFRISASSSTTATAQSVPQSPVDAGGAPRSLPDPSGETHTSNSTQESGTLAISDSGTYSFTAQRGQELTTAYFQYTGSENGFVSLNGLPDAYALDRFTPTEALSLSPTELPAGNKVDIRTVDQAGEPIVDAAIGVSHQRNNTDATLAGTSNADGLFTRGGSPVGIELVGDVLIQAEHPTTNEVVEREVTVTESTTFTLEFTDAGGDDPSPTVATYANENGRVDTGGLRTATDDWRNGTIDTGLLRNVIETWRSGSVVA